jgi:hypothetical protein
MQILLRFCPKCTGKKRIISEELNMRIVDLSVYLEENKFAEPFPMSIKLNTHSDSAKMMAGRLGLDPSAFNDGMSLTHEDFSGQYHCGTHVDAPFHFGPIVEGKPAKGIDEVPLDWFYRDGVRLDLRHIGHNELISAEDIKAALYPEKTDYMYFVARGDGTNQFSKTYKEHEAAMKKYGLLK